MPFNIAVLIAPVYEKKSPGQPRNTERLQPLLLLIYQANGELHLNQPGSTLAASFPELIRFRI